MPPVWSSHRQMLGTQADCIAECIAKRCLPANWLKLLANLPVAERVDLSSSKKNNKLAWLTFSKGPIDPKRVSARVANRGNPPGMKKSPPLGAGAADSLA